MLSYRNINQTSQKSMQSFSDQQFTSFYTQDIFVDDISSTCFVNNKHHPYKLSCTDSDIVLKDDINSQYQFDQNLPQTTNQSKISLHSNDLCNTSSSIIINTLIGTNEITQELSYSRLNQFFTPGKNNNTICNLEKSSNVYQSCIMNRLSHNNQLDQQSSQEYITPRQQISNQIQTIVQKLKKKNNYLSTENIENYIITLRNYCLKLKNKNNYLSKENIS